MDRWFRVPVAILSFWSTTVVPVFHIAVVLAGLNSVQGPVLFLGLFSIRVLALIRGRDQ